MKSLLTSTLMIILFCLNSYGQDVKIQPGGDIEIPGEIKPDGNAGQDGQVLKSNGAGGMEWASSCQFDNYDDFFNPASTSTWTVPAGVTLIEFELWGAGGGGAEGGGGGAGGYIKALLTVTPGDSYTITVGDGGMAGNATTSGGSGTNCQVTGPGVGILRANGGTGASTIGPGFGGDSNISSNLHAQRWRGGAGFANEIQYNEYGTEKFARIIKYGQGASSPFLENKGGFGMVQTSDNNTALQTYFAGFGMAPGGGGGGGGGVSIGGSGGSGADGYVIVRW